MKKFIRLLLCAVLAVPGIGFAATNGPPSAPLARFTCTGSTCTGVPNDASNTYYATISSQTAGLALDASIQQVVTILNAPLTINLPTGIATAANQATGNAFLSTLATFSTSASTSALQSTGNASLATIATNSGTQATASGQATGNGSLGTIATAQGAQGTGSTFNPPSGGSGVIGYLSGIYKAITGTVTISGSVTTTPSGGTVPSPYKVTLVNLDATSLSGSGAATILSAGHAAAGATVTASVAYCVNINGTAGNASNSPAGTQCGAGSGFAAGQSYAVPPTGNAVSMYGLTAGTASGSGAQ